MNYYIIENNLEKAAFYQSIGVDIIMVDLESLGKEERQKGLNTVKSKHTIEDIRKLRSIINKSELCVRIDPLNVRSKEQIDAVIACDADSIMLPYFKYRSEVQTFQDLVDGRVKTVLLFETPESIVNHENILKNYRPDRIHVGLNDLSLSLKNEFMFKSLTLNVIKCFCEYLSDSEIPFGIGGIARLDGGLVAGRLILNEYKRLGARFTILSRSFVGDFEKGEILAGYQDLTRYSEHLSSVSEEYFQALHLELIQKLEDL